MAFHIEAFGNYPDALHRRNQKNAKRKMKNSPYLKFIVAMKNNWNLKYPEVVE